MKWNKKVSTWCCISNQPSHLVCLSINFKLVEKYQGRMDWFGDDGKDIR